MSGVSEEQLQNSSTTNSNNNSGGIPLTTWINSALNSINNNTLPQQSPSPNQPQTVSNKINSTLYTSAALNIAQSLICQLNLSYSIGSDGQQELILPNDISNWSNSIVIHLNNNNSSSNGGEQSIEPIVNISRAEFTTPSQNTNEQIKCLSRDENKHIYSLGIVLYQLFSGNQAPLEKDVLDKLVMNAQLKIKEAYEKLSESERVRFMYVCVL